jgi:hypothetical protein
MTVRESCGDEPLFHFIAQGGRLLVSIISTRDIIDGKYTMLSV